MSSVGIKFAFFHWTPLVNDYAFPETLNEVVPNAVMDFLRPLSGFSSLVSPPVVPPELPSRCWPGGNGGRGDLSPVFTIKEFDSGPCPPAMLK